MPKSVIESEIERATSEYNVSEDWQSFMDICDQINTIQDGPKLALKAITKRCNHPVPHVAMQALTLLSTCVTNCGKSFHLEICSRDWTNEAKSIINRAHEKVSEKLRSLIQQWANEFKEDAQLNLMVQFYKKLKQDGYEFKLLQNGLSSDSKTKTSTSNSDELSFKDDLNLAIAISLQEADGNSKTGSSGTSSLYPSTPASYNPQQKSEKCVVRALYDFEAAEDNEMTFKAGETFSVLDNSDANWWEGRNERGTGLFPANFVTTDLSLPQETTATAAEKKKVRFSDEPQPQPTANAVQKKPVISEEHLDLTLHMLKNPNELGQEEDTITEMENTAKNMGPEIEKKISQSTEKQMELNALNEQLMNALTMYQQLIKQPAIQPQYQQQQQQQQQDPHQLYYQQQQNAQASYAPQIADDGGYYSHPSYTQQYAPAQYQQTPQAQQTYHEQYYAHQQTGGYDQSEDYNVNAYPVYSQTPVYQ